ncbi:MAG TPA: MerR family transcriptional regulator [Oculatellaceae cyanobacterium]
MDNTVMIVADTYELTIDELSSEVVHLLKLNKVFATHQDNRVSAAPDMRTIRYYSSLGLLDRPSIQGRVAKYNRRHVLQLLAIKLLQGLALPLSEIQERLYGLSDAELESVISSFAAQEEGTTYGSLNETETLRAVRWLEIVIEPGLKILADDSWLGETDSNVLENKIRAALNAFKSHAGKAIGEKK